LRLSDCIKNLQEADSIQKIKDLKKLAGYKTGDRIRIGEYRIGLMRENESFILVRFLHRKKIYRFFPESKKTFVRKTA